MKNKVNLIGRIGVMPELKEASNGNKYARFPLAVNQNYKDKKGNWVEDTQWMNLVIWGASAERLVERVQKGMEIAIEGKIINKQFEVNGEKRYATDIHVDDFMIPNIKATATVNN